MFRITSTIFNEVKEITSTELIELYENNTLQGLAYFFTFKISWDENDDGEPIYLDMTEKELIQDWLNGDHRLFKIKRNSLLFEAIGFVYGSYDGYEIAQENEKMAIDEQGDLYFFAGYNYDFINELFKDLGGRKAFLDRLNEDR